MKTIEEKYEALKRFIKEKGKKGVVIAFSGGVDSVTLAAISKTILKDKAIAVTAESSTYTSEELLEARKAAKEIGIKLIIVNTNELSDKNFVANSENRCYYCKKALLNRLKEVAEELGFKTVFEGTNFSDLAGHRPGYRAVEESEEIYSPWVESEFTKEEIREMAKKLKLSVQNKPPLACLASRIPFYERITTEKLNRIARAEKIVKKMTGVRQLRVRDHNGLARIEFEKQERILLGNVKTIDRIATELKKLGFKYVTVDLEGYRTGSMLHSIASRE